MPAAVLTATGMTSRKGLKGVSATAAEAAAAETSTTAKASAAEAAAARTGLGSGRKRLESRGGEAVHGAAEHQWVPHHAHAVAGANVPGGRFCDDALEGLRPVLLHAKAMA